MIYVAFTLGLFGSLHCLGMCGPLAFSFLPGINERSLSTTIRISMYNLGRVASYIILGLLFGWFGGLINFSGLQKPLTITVGLVLIVLFLMSLDLEKLLFKFPWYRKIYSMYSKFLSSQLNGLARKSSFLLGALNGLIPCGLVYLALAGALTSGDIFSGAKFMLFFGLGTFPAMFLLLLSFSLMDFKKNIRIKKVFAFLQLFVGIFLIYKAFIVDIPKDLSLIQSMVNPLICH